MESWFETCIVSRQVRSRVKAVGIYITEAHEDRHICSYDIIAYLFEYGKS